MDPWFNQKNHNYKSGPISLTIFSSQLIFYGNFILHYEFAHDSVMPYAKFVTIQWPVIELQQVEVQIEIELQAKKC